MWARSCVVKLRVAVYGGSDVESMLIVVEGGYGSWWGRLSSGTWVAVGEGGMLLRALLIGSWRAWGRQGPATPQIEANELIASGNKVRQQLL